jgi:hypothetical protein
MIRRVVAPIALLALAACTPDARPDTPVPIEREAITYSTQPCFGFCPVYSVTVTPDGEGVFEGRNHTATTGEQRFRLDPAAYRRFADHLASIKPEGDRRIDMQSPDCGMAPTDMPSIDVRWSTNTGGPDRSLHLYLGCRSEAAVRVAGVLKSAPDLLPIAQYIGKR